jgi:N-terminal domain of unknown function (DUF4140)
MRRFAIVFVLLFTASVAGTAEIEARSDVDSSTAYPDGATITRVIRVELPAGDTTLIASDFPPGLDPSSLRVEGETDARVVIGSIDARAPKATPPVNAPELEKKIEAARDQIRGTEAGRLASRRITRSCAHDRACRSFKVSHRRSTRWPIKVVVEDQQPVSEIDDE